MQKQLLQSAAVISGTLLFDFLFYGEYIGLNVLLLTLFFESALFYFYRASFEKRNVQFIAIGTLLLAACVVYTNSRLAIITFLLSFSCLVGLVHVPELRFLFFGALLYASNFLEVPRHMQRMGSRLPNFGIKSTLQKSFSSVFMSASVGALFFTIYYIANPRFASASQSVGDILAHLFNFSFDVNHIFFFAGCLFLTGAAIWKSNLFDFSAWQNSLSNSVSEENESASNETDKIQSSKMGIIILSTCNALLLVNNLTDIPFVWFNRHANFSPSEMKTFVHEGTFFLIFGILLAMGVLLWIFRSQPLLEINNPKKDFETNENRHVNASSTSLLRLLSTFWLLQNAFLVLSVGLRNAYYIGAFGLAYKRIGVIYFLVLTLCGLWFLYQKITKNESLYRFVARNGWSFYSVLLLASFMPWDTYITQFNLKHTAAENLDVRFLLNDVSDKNAYLLLQNKKYLIESAAKSNVSLLQENYYRQKTDSIVVDKEFNTRLNQKMHNAYWRIERMHFKSWNYPDYVNAKYISKSLNQ